MHRSQGKENAVLNVCQEVVNSVNDTNQHLPEVFFNPLPCMPILDSSSSTANKDMMSKIWTNRDTII